MIGASLEQPVQTHSALTIAKLRDQDLIAVMRNDKKSVAGRLRLVLPRSCGEVALFDDISEAEVSEALEASFT